MTCRKGPLTIKTACQNRQIKKIRITDHTRKIGLASGCLRSPKETCQSIGPGLAFKIMISIAYSSTMIKLQTQARSAASITQGICVDPEKHLIKYLASSQKNQPCPAIREVTLPSFSTLSSTPTLCPYNSKSPTRGPALRVLWTLPTCPQASYQAVAQQESKQERPDLWPKKQLLGTSGLPILCLISENPQESNLSLLKLISYLEFEIKRQMYLQIKEIDGEIKKHRSQNWHGLRGSGVHSLLPKIYFSLN